MLEESTMTRTTTTGWTAPTIVALAPIVLLVAFLAHPFLATLPDAEAVAASVEANTTRWAVAHLLTNVASGLLALAFLAVRSRLQAAGEDRFSRVGLPFVVFGSVLYGFLPGLEFAPLAAVETGGDVVATQGVLESWFVPVFVTGAVTFAIGVFAFARGIAASAILGARTTQTVVAALAVMAVARAIPLGVVQFHLQAVAALVALLPLAAAVRDRPVATTSARPHPRTSTAV